MKLCSSVQKFALCTLWLLLLLSNSVIYAAPQNNEDSLDDRRTLLIVQAPSTIHLGENATLVAQLATVQGELIPDVDIELVMDTAPAQHTRTNAHGVAIFQLPVKLAEGDYTLKAIFAGAPNLRTAIGVSSGSQRPSWRRLLAKLRRHQA